MGQFLGRDSGHIWTLLLVSHHVHALVQVHFLHVVLVPHLVEPVRRFVEVAGRGHVVRLEEVLARPVRLVASALATCHVVHSALNLHIVSVVVLRASPGVGCSRPPLLLLSGHVILHLVVAVVHVDRLHFVLGVFVSKQVGGQCVVVLRSYAAVPLLSGSPYSLVGDYVHIAVVHIVGPAWRENGWLLASAGDGLKVLDQDAQHLVLASLVGLVMAIRRDGG